MYSKVLWEWSIQMKLKLETTWKWQIYGNQGLHWPIWMIVMSLHSLNYRVCRAISQLTSLFIMHVINNFRKPKVLYHRQYPLLMVWTQRQLNCNKEPRHCLRKGLIVRLQSVYFNRKACCACGYELGNHIIMAGHPYSLPAVCFYLLLFAYG